MMMAMAAIPLVLVVFTPVGHIPSGIMVAACCSTRRPADGATDNRTVASADFLADRGPHAAADCTAQDSIGIAAISGTA